MRRLAQLGALLLGVAASALAATMLGGCNTLDAASGMEAYVDGGYVMVRVNPGAKLYIETCSNAFVLQKPQGDDWTVPEDDTPWGQDAGYFLNDHFVPSPRFGASGCDFVQCSQMDTESQVAPALEFVKTGTRDAPQTANDFSPAPIVDVIETRPLEGRLRVLVTYSTDSHCDDSQSATLSLNIPPAS